MRLTMLALAVVFTLAACSSGDTVPVTTEVPEGGTEIETEGFLAAADQEFLSDVLLNDATATDDARCYLSRDGDGALNPWIRCGPAAFGPDDAPWFTYPVKTVRTDSFDPNSPLTVETTGPYTADTEPDGLELLFRPDGKKPSDQNLAFGPAPLVMTSDDAVMAVYDDTCLDKGTECTTAEALTLPEGLDVCMQRDPETGNWAVWFNDSDDTETTLVAVEEAMETEDMAAERAVVKNATTFGHHREQGVLASWEIEDRSTVVDAVAATVTDADFVAVFDDWLLVEAADETAARDAFARYYVAAGYEFDAEANQHMGGGTIETGPCPAP